MPVWDPAHLMVVAPGTCQHGEMTLDDLTGGARDAAGRARGAAVAARDGAAEVARGTAGKVKPRLRGVIHQYSFFVALALGAALVVFAGGARARVAVIVYVISLCGLLGTSALYHRITWSGEARRRMRRLDHSMIFVLIAGTTTPIALLAVHGTLSTVLLCLVWGGALAGVLIKNAWIDAPKWTGPIMYVLVGWVGVIAVGSLLGTVGWLAVIGIGIGGVLYTVGAVIYATERPDPVPAVFGYHEVFHVLVVVAAAVHFAVITGWIVPLSA